MRNCVLLSNFFLEFFTEKLTHPIPPILSYARVYHTTTEEIYKKSCNQHRLSHVADVCHCRGDRLQPLQAVRGQKRTHTPDTLPTVTFNLEADLFIHNDLTFFLGFYRIA